MRLGEFGVAVPTDFALVSVLQHSRRPLRAAFALSAAQKWPRQP
jgi:hypothetical protein